MTRIAVVLADGCEEIEALTPIDVFRRLGIETTIVGLTSLTVTGAHQIPLTAQETLTSGLVDYDCVVFPGGSVGAANLRDSDELMKLMQARQQAGKWNAAMCAAPLAFARYGLLDGHRFTCYPGVEEEIAKTNPQATFDPAITVVDEAGHLITSRGPATALAFAYRIAQTLGVATADLEDGMLYTYLKQNI